MNSWLQAMNIEDYYDLAFDDSVLNEEHDMKPKTQPKINWLQLQNEYDQLRRDGENLLAWCTKKANECGLNYGQFVAKLGR